MADNNSTQNSSSADSTYRIETEPTALAFAFVDKAFPPERSNLFATQWVVEDEQQQEMKKVSPSSRLIQRLPQTLPERILQMSSAIQLNTTPIAISQSNKHQQSISATESKQSATQRVINSFASVKSQTTSTGKAQLALVKPLNSNQNFLR